MTRLKQRYETVLSDLLGKIFTGQLAAGIKLPTEKQLSQEMGIDRTSLRVALKQLEAMQLLEIRQGDGIYVKDYLRNAGIDSLRTLFLLKAEGMPRPSIDEYLFDELWEFWKMFLPEIITMAARKASPRDIKTIISMIDEEKNHIDETEKVIELELAQQDYIAQLTKNIVIILIFNSSRPLRKMMLAIILASISSEDLQKHFEHKLFLLREYMRGNSEKVFNGIADYGRILSQYQQMVKKTYWAKETDN